MSDAPSKVRELVETWQESGRPRQPPVDWRRSQWRAHFGAELETLSDAPIARKDVAKACKEAAHGADQARHGFLVAVARGDL